MIYLLSHKIESTDRKLWKIDLTTIVAAYVFELASAIKSDRYEARDYQFRNEQQTDNITNCLSTKWKEQKLRELQKINYST